MSAQSLLMQKKGVRAGRVRQLHFCAVKLGIDTYSFDCRRLSPSSHSHLYSRLHLCIRKENHCCRLDSQLRVSNKIHANKTMRFCLCVSPDTRHVVSEDEIIYHAEAPVISPQHFYSGSPHGGHTTSLSPSGQTPDCMDKFPPQSIPFRLNLPPLPERRTERSEDSLPSSPSHFEAVVPIGQSTEISCDAVNGAVSPAKRREISQIPQHFNHVGVQPVSQQTLRGDDSLENGDQCFSQELL